jgi:hypothetical protein
MTRMRAVLLACLATLFAVWVATTATLPFGRTAPEVPAAETAGDPGPLGSLDLERAATRLRARIEAAAAPAPPARNPFRFGSTPPARSAAPAPAPLPPAPLPESVPAPSAPPLALIGVAEQTIDGQVVRTAILSMGKDLYYVKTGERAGSAYEVVAIDAEGVEVKDLVSGSVRRITQP